MMFCGLLALQLSFLIMQHGFSQNVAVPLVGRILLSVQCATSILFLDGFEADVSEQKMLDLLILEDQIHQKQCVYFNFILIILIIMVLLLLLTNMYCHIYYYNRIVNSYIKLS